MLFIKKTYDSKISWNAPEMDPGVATDLGKITISDMDPVTKVYSPVNTQIKNWIAGVESFYVSFGAQELDEGITNCDVVSLGCGVSATADSNILTLSPYLQFSGMKPGGNWTSDRKGISLEGDLLLTISVVLTYDDMVV